ncbi:MAG: histidine--tRNA ligase [Thermodesulfobacteriota bacterium]
MKFKLVRGFHDILPENVRRWHYVEKCARDIFESCGFNEIRIPVLEFTGIYRTGIGSTTDIVEKEMYTFDDRDGSSLTLRPEGTAGVVRSYIENSLGKKSPTTKLYYIGPMFRHERPQKGRYRGFYQIGCEYFGSPSPNADAEIITMLWQFFEKIGFGDSVKLELNSIGDETSRKDYKNALLEHLSPEKDKLCDQCKRKLGTNPLRILDCKNESCRKITNSAPSIIDFLSPDSSDHFNKLIKILESLEIPFEINNRIVRGLDYYTETVFEFTTGLLGSQNAIAAGGRYNGLVEQMGGQSTPAVGFALGLERIIILHEQLTTEGFEPYADIFIAWMGDDSFTEGFKIANEIRKSGKTVVIEHDQKSLKSQLKRSDRLNAGFTIIIGEQEVKDGTLIIRDMSESVETRAEINNLDKILETIK